MTPRYRNRPAYYSGTPAHRDTWKLVQSKPELAADHHYIECLLSFSTPYPDVRIQAKTVLAEYGSLAKACRAEWAALKALGLTDEGADAIRSVGFAADMVKQEEDTQERVWIRTQEDAVEYIDTHLAPDQPEWLAVLYLDVKNGAHRAVLIQDGSPSITDQTGLELIRHGLRENARQMAMLIQSSKNAPSPRTEEVLALRKMLRTGELIGLDLLELYYRGRHGVKSFIGWVEPLDQPEPQKSITKEDIEAIRAALDAATDQFE